MTTMNSALGFSYWKETAPERLGSLNYHKSQMASKRQVVLAAKNQLEWLSMHENPQEQQARQP